MLYTNSNILCSICTKTSYVWLKCFSEDIYMPISTYSHSATSWQQEVLAHINDFDILLLYFLFKCILLTVPCLSEATVGGEPGCEVPFIAACSFNYYYYSLRNESHFWGPKQARKVTKLCNTPRSGENLHLIWVSKVGVAKWLDSATYTLSTVCASSNVSRTCMKISTLM